MSCDFMYLYVTMQSKRSSFYLEICQDDSGTGLSSAAINTWLTAPPSPKLRRLRFSDPWGQ